MCGGEWLGVQEAGRAMLRLPGQGLGGGPAAQKELPRQVKSKGC